jgi:hypothetical protein
MVPPCPLLIKHRIGLEPLPKIPALLGRRTEIEFRNHFVYSYARTAIFPQIDLILKKNEAAIDFPVRYFSSHHHISDRAWSPTEISGGLIRVEAHPNI